MAKTENPSRYVVAKIGGFVVKYSCTYKYNIFIQKIFWGVSAIMDEIKRFFINFKTNIIDEYPLYTILVAAAIVLLIVGIVVAVTVSKKKKKAKSAENAENIVVAPEIKEEEQIVPPSAPAEEIVSDSAPVAEEETDRERIEEKPVINLAKEDVGRTSSDDEWKPASLTAKREPKKEAPVKAEETEKKEEEYDPFQKAVITAPKKSAKPKAEPEKVEKEEATVAPKAAPKATKKAAAPKAEKAAPAEEKPAPVEEPVKKPVQKDIDMNETAATVMGKKVVGKYVIDANEDFYQFSLYANNGQLLYESREYATLATCKSGIETFKKNVAECDYRIAQDKNGNWKYIFRKGNSIYIGESYSTEQSAENSAESTKRFAGISELQEK